MVKNVPLWIACEVSCRIRVREFKDPVRRGKHLAQGYPGRFFRWKGLLLTDFTPRQLFDCRLWFLRLCQLVTLHLIRWQSSAPDQVTLLYRRLA